MIAHIIVRDKFIPEFISFMVENFNIDNHFLWLTGDAEKYPSLKHDKIYEVKSGFINKTFGILFLIYKINSAKKIILHSLFHNNVLVALFLMPWLLKKTYWVMWGGDLYTCQLDKKTTGWWIREFFRRFVIRRIGHFVTHIHGDYELAQKWYGAKGVWHECFMYPSNLYQEPPPENTPHEGINILLGNSADPSNIHIDPLDKLRPYVAEDIHIFCPLSYGDADYAKQVADYGNSIFGDKFNPLLEFMRFDEYKKLLARIDIAIFNHNRQQGMGNITTLLGMGKKVFMRSDITSYHAIRSLGAFVYDVEHLDISPLDESHSSINSNIIANYFSRNNLVNSWQKIYEG